MLTEQEKDIIKQTVPLLKRKEQKLRQLLSENV